MNDTQRDTGERATNPWKIGVFATTGALLLLVAAGITFAAFKSGQSSTVQPEVVSQVAPQAASAPPAPSPAMQPEAVSQAAPQPTSSAPQTPGTVAQPRENCDQYRTDGQRDSMRIAKDGAVGAMVGAGTGAAGGAIADGGSGAGTGAGIGAVVGAVAGAAYGLTQENTRVSDVERAYQDCLARNDQG